MKANVSVFLALLALSHFSQAAEHPIDAYVGSCINRDPSTAGMVSCTNQAYLLWDKELNSSYNNLLSSLTPKQKQALRSAQRQWIAFRDAEFAAIDAIYQNKEGTMYIPMRAADRMELVKARALQLAAHKNLVSE